MDNLSQCDLIASALFAGRVLTATDIYDLFGVRWMNHKGRVSDLRIKRGMNIPQNQLVPVRGGNGKTKHIGIYYLGTLYSYEEALKRRFPNQTAPRPRNPQGQFLAHEQSINKGILEEASTLYRQGKSFREIGKELGIPWPTVYKHLRDSGIIVRPKGQLPLWGAHHA